MTQLKFSLLDLMRASKGAVLPPRAGKTRADMNMQVCMALREYGYPLPDPTTMLGQAMGPLFTETLDPEERKRRISAANEPHHRKSLPAALKRQTDADRAAIFEARREKKQSREEV